MKKLALIATLLLSIVFIRCSDDKSENPDTEDNEDNTELIGKWRLDYFTPYLEDGETRAIETCEKESIYEYTADGKYNYEYVLNIEEATGISECAVDGTGTATYTASGNTITFVDGDETTVVTYTIADDILTLTYENVSIDEYLKTTDPFFSEL